MERPARERFREVGPPRPSRELVARARELRRASTPAEEHLWTYLRGRRLHGRKFRRQHPFGTFIADFFCHEALLVVEVDGAVHLEPTQEERDRAREEVLRRCGLSVLRFRNEDVLQETDEVLKAIGDFLLAHSEDATST